MERQIVKILKLVVLLLGISVVGFCQVQVLHISSSTLCLDTSDILVQSLAFSKNAKLYIGDSMDWVLEYNEKTGEILNVSEKFMRSKVVCKAICKYHGHGHVFMDNTPQIMYLTDPPQEPARQRKCLVCGLEQTQEKQPEVITWENNK